jgi:BASS family bile acid:Na+ symporter
MDPLLLVIVTFGVIFVVCASLAQGFSVTAAGVRATLRAHSQLSIMLLISNFILVPALLIGLASLVPFHAQVKMAIILLAITAGSPFIPWLVAQGKGDVGYGAVASLELLVATLLVLPWALPLLLDTLHTGASISPWTVTWPLLLFIVVPLLIGMLCRARYPHAVADVAPWLGPLSVTFLLVHVSLYIGYSWSELLSIAGDAQLLFILVFPLGGMLVGYLLSPPYVLSPVPAAHPQRGTKIVSAVAVAQQNTGAVICCLIVPLGKYVVAGDYALLGCIVTIVVVLVGMLEVGKRQSEAVTATQVSVATPGPAPAQPGAAAAG